MEYEVDLSNKDSYCVAKKLCLFIKHKLNWERKTVSQIIIYIVTNILWQAASGVKFDFKAYQMGASIMHLSAVVHYLR